MIQFYAPDIESTLTLPESDSAHCVKVLRRGMGDEVVVVDGRGHRFTCSIVNPHAKRTLVEITGREDAPLPWPYDITVGVAPTKHLDRMEWLVEKLVEIGVNRIIPLRCRYSERKEIKVVRLEKIAVSAMKQSLKAVMPEILPMTTFKEAIAMTAGINRFIAYCNPSIERRLLSREYRPGSDMAIFIGPEGDFSEEEIKIALGEGFHPVSLGENRLRTETAALVACDTVHIINQVHNIEQ